MIQIVVRLIEMRCTENKETTNMYIVCGGTAKNTVEKVTPTGEY